MRVLKVSRGWPRRSGHRMTSCAGVRGGAAVGGCDVLFTDIEGSTRRWETDAEAMRAAHSIVINPKQPRTEEANGTEAAHPFVAGAAWL
ncbi:MAG: hypothetical protein QOI01_724 [Mycobacterium sp.]|nr:hypothetical protein [Mycobacterium sp.]